MSDTNEDVQPKWVNNSAVTKAPEQLETNARGEWVYPSQLAQGFEPVELPALEGNATPTETLLLKDLGDHISNKVESSFKCSYLTKQTPVQVLQHYTAMVKELQLMDSGAIGRMEDIATELSQVDEKEAYYEMVVKPYLCSLTPRRR